MATIKRFEDIKAWQSARMLSAKIFVLMNDTPLKHDFKLKEQINGASGSIKDNIAEGFGRAGNNEFIQFLEIVHASACETQSQLYRVKIGIIYQKNILQNYMHWQMRVKTKSLL